MDAPAVLWLPQFADNLVTYGLFLIFLLYPGTTTKIFSAFVCDPIDAPGGETVRGLPELDS